MAIGFFEPQLNWGRETIKVYNNVQIIYEGEIYQANAYYSNTINSAVSASEVIISEGDVLIPE